MARVQGKVALVAGAGGGIGGAGALGLAREGAAVVCADIDAAAAEALAPHGIRVNAIAPGAIGGGTGFAADPSLVQKIPLGRIGTGEDIATMAVALLSERFGGYVTGSTFRVDGGLGLISWFDPAE